MYIAWFTSLGVGLFPSLPLIAAPLKTCAAAHTSDVTPLINAPGAYCLRAAWKSLVAGVDAMNQGKAVW